jgi:hypothetical protein
VRLTVEVDPDCAVDVDGGVGQTVARVGRPELGHGQLGFRGQPSLNRQAACHSVRRAPSTSM